MIKVMRNAQKIIRRDPDLMTVMQININDNDITNANNENKKKDEKKEEVKKPMEKKDSKPVQEKPKTTVPALKSQAGEGKKKNFGNLFG